MYPKTFFAAKKFSVKVGTCFVLMPFQKSFDEVYASLKRTIEGPDLGFVCTRADDIVRGGHIMEDVLQGIAESEIVLVDVTDRNPNVFYELGIAHMIKEVNNILLISQSSSAESIPFDVAAMRYLVYEPNDSGMREIGQKLIQAVCSVSDRVHRIVVPNNGNGELAYRLMGEDDYLYSFAISQCHIAYNGAEFRLQVTRHAALEEPRVVFDRGLGLTVGNKVPVPEVGWYLTLAKCTDASAMFVIDETAEPDSAIGVRGRRGRKSSSVTQRKRRSPSRKP